MAEYINREAAMRAVLGEPTDAHYPGWYAAILMELPAADVAPVVHGRWAHLGGDEWCCSACGFVITTEGSWDKPNKKYCDDCGAKMDGGDNDETD